MALAWSVLRQLKTQFVASDSKVSLCRPNRSSGTVGGAVRRIELAHIFSSSSGHSNSLFKLKLASSPTRSAVRAIGQLHWSACGRSSRVELSRRLRQAPVLANALASQSSGECACGGGRAKLNLSSRLVSWTQLDDERRRRRRRERSAPYNERVWPLLSQFGVQVRVRIRS